MGASVVTTFLLVTLILSSISTENLPENAGGEESNDDAEELDMKDWDQATKQEKFRERISKDQKESGVQVEIMEESKECSRYDRRSISDPWKFTRVNEMRAVFLFIDRDRLLF